MNTKNQDWLIVIIMVCVTSVLVYFMEDFLKEPKVTGTTPAVSEDSKPKIEILKYEEHFDYPSYRYVNGTVTNNYTQPISLTLWTDQYDINDTYLGTKMTYASYLEPQKKWDFYVTVDDRTTHVKIRQEEFIHK